MAHTFQTVIVEIDMGDFYCISRKTFFVDTKTVILGGDLHMAGGQIFYRLVTTPMTEFQFIG